MSGEDPDTDNEALAAAALQYFKEKNPTKALDCLSKLKSKGKENDPKILHNIALTEYYMNGTSDPQKLLDELGKVKALVLEKTTTAQSESGEGQEEGVPPSEDIDSALLQYNQAVLLFQTRKYASALEILTRLFKTIEPIEDYLAVRICFLLVDLYILMKQPEKGFGVIAYLEKLHANLNKPAEEKPALDKEEKEKEYQKEKEKDKENKEKEKENKSKDKEKDKDKDKDKESVSESLFQKPEPIPPSTYSYDSPTKVLCLSPLELDFSIHLYKSKLHLLRPSTDLDLAKEEIKHAMAAGAKVHPLTAPMCVFMKAHQEYLRGNHKKAITLMQACAQKGGPAAGVTAPNNGCFGFDIQFDGPIPAFPSLPSSSTSNNSDEPNENANGVATPNNTAALSPLFFNNLGCIHYKLKQFSAASFYVNRALKDSEALYSNPSATNNNNNNNSYNNDETTKRGSVDQFARDRKIEMLYNLGLQMLLTGKPELAFQAFQEVALMYYKSPQVWLRLAESCVASHVLKLREEAKNSQKSPLVWKVVGGNGTPRHILLPTTGGPHRGLQVKDSETSISGEETEDASTSSSSSTRVGSMSLEYAAKCLRNCLFLLRAALPPNPSSTPSSTPSSDPNNRPSTPPSPTPSSTSPPGSPSSSPSTTNGTTSTPTTNLESNNDMRQAALANLSFVSLALANPVVALTSAQELLSLPTHTEVYKYLAHVYAAESLCMLGRATEATEHLSPSIIDELIPPNSTVSPLQGTHPSPYSSLTSHSQPLSAVARNMLYTNLAASHILRDDLAQAQACITQALTHQPSSTKALLLQVYLELRKGNNDIALELLKRGRPFPKRKTKR
eukprot:Phypoly_transcript_02870.p1 GENE.Phypoly_transcript_02870~~Phypoly_transcript_02870.p1  ORF type:complete len:843 (+),score=269.67 Phypoly_transcript_02870:83-2611(+)